MYFRFQGKNTVLLGFAISGLHIGLHFALSDVRRIQPWGQPPSFVPLIPNEIIVVPQIGNCLCQPDGMFSARLAEDVCADFTVVSPIQPTSLQLEQLLSAQGSRVSLGSSHCGNSHSVNWMKRLFTQVSWELRNRTAPVVALADSRGALWARAPLAPKIFFKIMQFSGICKGKKPYFEQILSSGQP